MAAGKGATVIPSTAEVNMRLPAFAALLLLAACSVNEERYVSELTAGDCAYALTCWDDSVLTQYGWTSQEACEADQGPVNARLPIDCAVYDKKAARECIKALDERSCVDSEDPTELGRPEICAQVFTSCEGGDSEDTDSVEPSDDTDTDPDSDA